MAPRIIKSVYTKSKLGKKFWIHASNIVCKGWREGLDMGELENAPEMQKCPKTFEHDCTLVPCPWAIVCLLLSASRGRNLRGGGSKISFLDTWVHLGGNAKTRIAAYRKPTHTDQYLHFASSHHLEYKRLRFVMFRQTVRKSSSESKWVVSRPLMV